ncbi:hypothetical protein GW17_00010237, partial [Ensete ventricosum]
VEMRSRGAEKFGRIPKRSSQKASPNYGLQRRYLYLRGREIIPRCLMGAVPSVDLRLGRRNEAVERGDHGGVVDERGAPAVAAGGVVDLRRVPVRRRRLLSHRDPSEASQEARPISSLFLQIVPSQIRCFASFFSLSLLSFF